MAVIALVALIVIGPKDLPHAMRAASKWVRKARGLAREFQSGVDEMIREAELDDARKALQATRDMDLDKALEQTVDPTGQVRDEAQSLEAAARNEDESPSALDEAAAANVAPPHSLTPPAAEGEGASTKPAAASPGGDGTAERSA